VLTFIQYAQALDGVDNLLIEQIAHSMYNSLRIGGLELTIFGEFLKLFKGSQFFDTAVFPELIYHEYAHLFLKNTFSDKFSTALNEGYPDYFSYKMLGVRKMYSKSNGHARRMREKNGDRNLYYALTMDLGSGVHLDFGYSVLIRVEEAFPIFGEEIIINALQYIDWDSNIRHDFEWALMRSIRDISPNWIDDQITLTRILVDDFKF